MKGKSDSNLNVSTTHLVLEGFPQCVIGRNVTRKANLEHIKKNSIAFLVNNAMEYISLIIENLLYYVPVDKIINHSDVESEICFLNRNVLNDISWSKTKSTI